MNPDIEWQHVFEILGMVVVLAFLLERTLALLFENRHFIANCENRGLKEPIAFGLALIVSVVFDFDAVSAMLGRDSTQLVGHLITAGVIAGGSKASVKLFRDVLDFKSAAFREAEQEQERVVAVRAALRAGFRPATPAGGDL